MSTLQERLRREAEFMLDRGIVTRGQRLVSAGEMREAADVLEAIDKLHHPVEWHRHGWFCHLCPEPWPCTHHRLLHPEEGSA